MGTAFPTVVPYRVFHTKDRAVAIAVGSEKLWSAFCRAIERPDLERHAEYASNAERIRNRHTLEPLLEEVFHRVPWRSGSHDCKRLGFPALRSAISKKSLGIRSRRCGVCSRKSNIPRQARTA